MLNSFRIFIIVILIFHLFEFTGTAQDLVINEFMSANEITIQDKDGDYSDWIEIFNGKSDTINLLYYHLSDDIADIGKWEFPEYKIPPQGFLLIFASGKNINDISELHTNFKVSQAGEELYLSDANMQVVSSVNAISLADDNSYGRKNDGTLLMIVFDSSTPGYSNEESSDIYSSNQSGFYNSEFDLTLVPVNESYNIRYTLNGGIPNSNSVLYISEIKISNNSDTPYSFSTIPTTPLEGPYQLDDFIWKEPERVYKANILRYAGFEGDEIKSKVFTKVFFVDPNIENRYSFPVVSIVTDSLNLFDYDTGIYIPGKVFDENGYNWWPEGNYHERGIDWERNIYISFFESNGDLGFESDAGMRMRGYGSTANPQKSFGVYFREEYDLSKIIYPIFDNSDNDIYKRLIFRNSGGDFLFTHFRDGMLQNMLSLFDLDLQGFEPSVVFINGEYWGIHGIRQKYDKYYFKYNFGIDEDNINILGVCGGVDEGSNIDYQQLIYFLNNNDITLSESYAYLNTRIDIQNFIDYLIAEIYYANYDWPCNNYKMWKTNDPGSKWRFLIYDLDLSFNFDKSSEFNIPSIEHALSTNNEWPYCECSNIIFRKLIENEKFKNDFIDRFAYHLNNTFKISSVIDTINFYQNQFVPEMQEHIDRWGYPSDVSRWYYYVEDMKEFARKRPCYMREYIIDYFDLVEFDFDCVQEERITHTLSIYPNPGDGSFFVRNISDEMIIGTLDVLTITGQNVYSKQNVIITGNGEVNLNLKHLPAGTYILTFYNEEYFDKKKLVIIK